MRYFCRPATAVLLVVWIAAGCARTREFEIDASSAKDFKWSGKIRVIETRAPVYGPFLMSTDITSVDAVELVGEKDRSIVILPTGRAVSDHPLARVQDQCTPPSEVLAMSLRRESSGFVGQVDPFQHPQSRPTELTDEEVQQAVQQEFDDMAQDGKILKAIQERRFGDISAAQVARSVERGAISGRCVYQYGLADGTTVSIEWTLGCVSVVTLTLRDGAGTLLHKYEPERLETRQVKQTARR